MEAYIDKYTSLVPYLDDAAVGTPASDPAPPEQTSKAISLQVSQLRCTEYRQIYGRLQSPVFYDGVPLWKSFGSVLLDVRTGSSYHAQDTVQAVFLGANPRVSD